jgi:hypothetical protein
MKQHDADNKQRLGSSFDYSSSLNMEATYSAETSIDFQLTTRICNREDISLRIPDVLNPMGQIPLLGTNNRPAGYEIFLCILRTQRFIAKVAAPV